MKVIRKPVVLGKLPSPNPPKDITVPPLGVPLKTCSVFQLTPIDGSPQSSPNPGGDMWIEYDGVVVHVSGVPVGVGVGDTVGVGLGLGRGLAPDIVKLDGVPVES